MKFSHRTDWNLAENDLTLAVRQRRAQSGDLVDLTVSNPTTCGLMYDPEHVLGVLADPAALVYRPDPLGVAGARDAVAGYYADLGGNVPADQICLTTSTSEAYSFLFRLLCDPGDEVLVARPSYPLFDFIARLDAVELREYPLFYDPNTDPNALLTSPVDADAAGQGSEGGWAIDLDTLEAAIGTRTRAIVVVHPNNPTGNFVSAAEREALGAICARRGLALIVDEVFLDYYRGPLQPRSFAAGEMPCLTFVLSGLSKVCALPQMKVSWIAAVGPEDAARVAMARLEVIADTFLSVNAPMQLALPRWLAGRSRIQDRIRERMQINLSTLDERLRHGMAHRLAMQGGWTVVLRVPRTVDGVGFAEAALGSGVLVQPGDFYGLPEGRAVLSLLTPPELWAEGLRRLPVD
jgi:alanine-synthesizing transaminase